MFKNRNHFKSKRFWDLMKKYESSVMKRLALGATLALGLVGSSFAQSRNNSDDVSMSGSIGSTTYKGKTYWNGSVVSYGEKSLMYVKGGQLPGDPSKAGIFYDIHHSQSKDGKSQLEILVGPQVDAERFYFDRKDDTCIKGGGVEGLGYGISSSVTAQTSQGDVSFMAALTGNPKYKEGEIKVDVQGAVEATLKDIAGVRAEAQLNFNGKNVYRASAVYHPNSSTTIEAGKVFFEDGGKMRSSNDFKISFNVLNSKLPKFHRMIRK